MSQKNLENTQHQPLTSSCTHMHIKKIPDMYELDMEGHEKMLSLLKGPRDSQVIWKRDTQSGLQRQGTLN